MLIQKGFNLVKGKTNTFLQDNAAKKEQDTEQRAAVSFLHSADLHQTSICSPGFFLLNILLLSKCSECLTGKARYGSQNTAWRGGNSLNYFITLSSLGRLRIEFFPGWLSWCKEHSISIFSLFKRRSSIQIIVLHKFCSWAPSFYSLGFIV